MSVKKCGLIVLYLAVMYACQSSLKSVVVPAEAQWETLSSPDGSELVKRHEAAFVRVKDKFYLIGGRRMNPTSIFDAKTKTWTQGAKVPIEIHHLQPVVYNDKVFILGALTGKYPGETPIPHVYIYDPVSDSWEKGAEIPEHRRRGGAGAVVYKNKIYLACGIKDGHRGDHKNWLDEYNPKTGQWRQLPDAPRSRDHFQAVVANDQLYLLGGRTTISSEGPFKNTIKEVDVYDFKTGVWSTLKEGIPTPRAGNYATLVGDEILVLGGESATQQAAHSEVEALNVNTQSWRSLAPMIQGRHGTGVVQHDHKLYVASGSGNRGGGPELTSMEYLKVKIE